MTPFQLRQAIEQGLRDSAPEEVAELEKAGSFSRFLASRVEAAEQEIEEIENPAATKVHKSDLPYLERVQALTEARRRAESVAIAHAIDL
jgi:hypothetical protein